MSPAPSFPPVKTPGGRGRRVDWRLCFVADAETAAGRDLGAVARAAVRGGATMVQLRAKELDTRAFLKTAKLLGDGLRELRVPFIVNDRVDIALACGAAGVHLGRDDMPCAEARKLLGRNRLIGVSASTVAEAEEAERLGADYIGAWPVFPTSTKVTGRPPLGLGGLRRIRGRVGVPVLAIGGITVSNASAVMAAGADGLAVVSAILSAADPERAASALLAAAGPRRPGR